MENLTFSEESYLIIKETLVDCRDKLLATFKYLDHQYSLPEAHRVMEYTEEEALASMERIKPIIQSYSNALDELEDFKPKPKVSWEGD